MTFSRCFLVVDNQIQEYYFKALKSVGEDSSHCWVRRLNFELLFINTRQFHWSIEPIIWFNRKYLSSPPKRTRRRPGRPGWWWRIIHVFIHVRRQRQEFVFSGFFWTVVDAFLFSLTLFRFTGDFGRPVTVLADFVRIEGFLVSCMRKSWVWHSIDRFGVARTALAYDVVAWEVNAAVTSRLASQ